MCRTVVVSASHVRAPNDPAVASMRSLTARAAAGINHAFTRWHTGA
jgi:hypothetical protein